MYNIEDNCHYHQLAVTVTINGGGETYQITIKDPKGNDYPTSEQVKKMAKGMGFDIEAKALAVLERVSNKGLFE